MVQLNKLIQNIRKRYSRNRSLMLSINLEFKQGLQMSSEQNCHSLARTTIRHQKRYLFILLRRYRKSHLSHLILIILFTWVFPNISSRLLCRSGNYQGSWLVLLPFRTSVPMMIARLILGFFLVVIFDSRWGGWEGGLQGDTDALPLSGCLRYWLLLRSENYRATRTCCH